MKYLVTIQQASMQLIVIINIESLHLLCFPNTILPLQKYPIYIGIIDRIDKDTCLHWVRGFSWHKFSQEANVIILEIFRLQSQICASIDWQHHVTYLYIAFNVRESRWFSSILRESSSPGLGWAGLGSLINHLSSSHSISLFEGSPESFIQNSPPPPCGQHSLPPPSACSPPLTFCNIGQYKIYLFLRCWRRFQMSCRSYKEICLKIIDRFAKKVIISKCENYRTNFSVENTYKLAKITCSVFILARKKKKILMTVVTKVSVENHVWLCYFWRGFTRCPTLQIFEFVAVEIFLGCKAWNLPLSPTCHSVWQSRSCSHACVYEWCILVTIALVILWHPCFRMLFRIILFVTPCHTTLSHLFNRWHARFRTSELRYTM